MEIRAEGISRRYFRQGRGTNFFYAVQKTDFLLPAGCLTEISGRSGSGKSTLLNMLAGLLEPTEGRVLLVEEDRELDLYTMPDRERSMARNRKIGVIPQGQTGLQSLTVLENVMLPGLLYPGTDIPSGKALRERAEELLRMVGISELAGVWPNELSGGELRRLSIARALLLSPGILLADEPTGDLDDENTKGVLRLLRECADRGTAVLLVTHEQSAAAYADRIYDMSEGVLREGKGRNV